MSDAVFKTLINSKMCVFVFIPDSRINSFYKRLAICASGIPYIELYNPGWPQHQHHIWRGVLGAFFLFSRLQSRSLVQKLSSLYGVQA